MKNFFKKIYWKTDMFLTDVADEFDKFKLFVWGIFAPKQVTYFYDRFRQLRDQMDELDEQYDADINNLEAMIVKLKAENKKHITENLELLLENNKLHNRLAELEDDGK